MLDIDCIVLNFRTALMDEFGRELLSVMNETLWKKSLIDSDESRENIILWQEFFGILQIAQLSVLA